MEAEQMTEAELVEATQQVLFPDTTDPRRLTVAGKTILLRPLPIKHARVLNARVKPFEELLQGAGENVKTLDLIDRVTDVFTDLVVYILSYYGVQGCNKEWVEEHLTDDEVREIISLQLEVGNAHSFLLSVVRAIFGAVAQMTKALENNFPRQPSSPASASNGASLSTPSSPPTPTAN